MPLFDDLTKAEEKLINAVTKGLIANYEEDISSPPAEPVPGKTIRAALIVYLAVNEDPKFPIHIRGIHVKGAEITGQLDFEFATLKYPLVLMNCRLEKMVLLNDATAEVLVFSGSTMPGFKGDRLNLKRSLFINRIDCKGPFILRDAHVGGSINANNAKLNNADSFSLEGVGLHVGKSVYFVNGFSSVGMVNLIDASIEGSLMLNSATLTNPGKFCLDGSRLNVKGSIFFVNGFNAEGEVKLVLAQIGGELLLEGAVLINPGGSSLNAQGMTVKGAVTLNNGFRSQGKIILSYGKFGSRLIFSKVTLENPNYNIIEAYELTTGSSISFTENFKGVGKIILVGSSVGGALSFTRSFQNEGTIDATRALIRHSLIVNDLSLKGQFLIRGCEVGGDLQFTKARIENNSMVVLDSSVANIKGDCFYVDGQFEGEFRLNGIRIGGNLNVSGTSFINEQSLSFSGDNMTVGNNFRLNNVKSKGELRLSNARIEGETSFQHCTLESGKTNSSLYAFGMFVKGNVQFLPNFTSKGTVNLSRSTIEGNLHCNTATLKINSDHNGNDSSFIAPYMNVKGTLFWNEMSSQPEGKVNLRSVSVTRLQDDLKSWPKKGELMLENFVYSSFQGQILSVKERLDWLRRNSPFLFQPYEQAAKVYKSMGHVQEARKISRAKQNDLRKFGRLSKTEKFFNWFLDFTIGQGYQVWRVGIISIAIIVIWAILFAMADRMNVMVGVKEDGNYPAFHPFVYSADIFLPIVNLRQKDYWLPDRYNSSSPVFMVFLWVEILLGWLLTTLGIASITGIVKKD